METTKQGIKFNPLFQISITRQNGAKIPSLSWIIGYLPDFASEVQGNRKSMFFLAKPAQKLECDCVKQ